MKSYKLISLASVSAGKRNEIYFSSTDNAIPDIIFSEAKKLFPNCRLEYHAQEFVLPNGENFFYMIKNIKPSNDSTFI